MVKPGHYVQLVVSDTGCGSDEQMQTRIFDPFFTTKEQGKDTGPGLATAYGVVKQSGGYIGVYSEVGHGADFKIYFSMIDVAADNPNKDDTIEASRGSETIFVLEGDALLREVTCEFLQSRVTP